MTLRHTSVKTTLDKGYATEWNANHEINYATRITVSSHFYGRVFTGDWDLTQETSTTATAVTIVGSHVAVRLNATGGAGNFSSMRWMLQGAASDIFGPTDLPIAYFSIDCLTPTADANTHEFGMFPSAQALFAANNEGAYFRIGNNVLYAVTGTGAAETTSNLGAPDQYAVYKIEILSTSVKFYIDDLETAVATHSTNMPTNDMTIKVCTAQRAGGSNLINMDGVGFTVLRHH